MVYYHEARGGGVLGNMEKVLFKASLRHSVNSEVTGHVDAISAV